MTDHCAENTRLLPNNHYSVESRNEQGIRKF